MSPVRRRTLLQGALALPMLGATRGFAEIGEPGLRGVRVSADQDRSGQRRKVFGALPIDVKVAAADTGGGLLLIEQVDDVKGGPPKHVHPRQDEWFYVLDSTYVAQIGDETFELGPGDSLLAPRGVPHVWAHTGDGVGRMLIGFSPAGEMEAFFAEATKLAGVPTGPELARLFSAHGMEVLGPPLKIG